MGDGTHNIRGNLDVFNDSNIQGDQTVQGDATVDGQITRDGKQVPNILTGLVDPSANADFIGQIFVNTAAPRIFQAVNTGTGPLDWLDISVGGAPPALIAPEYILVQDQTQFQAAYTTATPQSTLLLMPGSYSLAFAAGTLTPGLHFRGVTPNKASITSTPLTLTGPGIVRVEKVECVFDLTVDGGAELQLDSSDIAGSLTVDNLSKVTVHEGSLDNFTLLNSSEAIFFDGVQIQNVGNIITDAKLNSSFTIWNNAGAGAGLIISGSSADVSICGDTLASLGTAGAIFFADDGYFSMACVAYKGIASALPILDCTARTGGEVLIALIDAGLASTPILGTPDPGETAMYVAYDPTTINYYTDTDTQSIIDTLSTAKAGIFTGAGTPNGAVTPHQIGDFYVDTTAKDTYSNQDGTNTGWQIIDIVTIQEEGAPLPKQSVLNFIGDSVTAANGAGSTDITVQVAEWAGILLDGTFAAPSINFQYPRFNAGTGQWTVSLEWDVSVTHCVFVSAGGSSTGPGSPATPFDSVTSALIALQAAGYAQTGAAQVSIFIIGDLFEPGPLDLISGFAVPVDFVHFTGFGIEDTKWWSFVPGAPFIDINSTGIAASPIDNISFSNMTLYNFDITGTCLRINMDGGLSFTPFTRNINARNLRIEVYPAIGLEVRTNVAGEADFRGLFENVHLRMLNTLVPSFGIDLDAYFANPIRFNGVTVEQANNVPGASNPLTVFRGSSSPSGVFTPINDFNCTEISFNTTGIVTIVDGGGSTTNRAVTLYDSQISADKLSEGQFIGTRNCEHRDVTCRMGFATPNPTDGVIAIDSPKSGSASFLGQVVDLTDLGLRSPLSPVAGIYITEPGVYTDAAGILEIRTAAFNPYVGASSGFHEQGGIVISNNTAAPMGVALVDSNAQLILSGIDITSDVGALVLFAPDPLEVMFDDIAATINDQVGVPGPNLTPAIMDTGLSLASSCILQAPQGSFIYKDLTLGGATIPFATQAFGVGAPIFSLQSPGAGVGTSNLAFMGCGAAVNGAAIAPEFPVVLASPPASGIM